MRAMETHFLDGETPYQIVFIISSQGCTKDLDAVCDELSSYTKNLKKDYIRNHIFWGEDKSLQERLEIMFQKSVENSYRKKFEDDRLHGRSSEAMQQYQEKVNTVLKTIDKPIPHVLKTQLCRYVIIQLCNACNTF